MPIDGVLKEACRKVGGVRELARRLNVTKQAINGFSIDGFSDSRALALKLIDEAGVGAAPGAAFGPGGEGHLRVCFARDPEQIAEATRRMARWLPA